MSTINTQLPIDAVPEIVWDAEPELVELHRFAWQKAWEHVQEYPGAPQTPYMDEAHTPGSIWIWDTCFMALFCKYAPDRFPGVESLDNFYKPIHDVASTTLRIHHLDNPPLFAWVEWENFLFTGDAERLREVYQAGYLQKHFALMERLPLPEPLPCSPNETFFRKTPLGYHWAGCCSGMDNTPRGGGGAAPGARPDDSRFGYPDILWVDALAQQALTAECLAKMAALFGDATEAERWQAVHQAHGELLNRHYWDEADGIYYDIHAAAPHARHKVKTPAAFWPMLAGLCSCEQAERLADQVANPAVFGGAVPFPSVSRDDPAFDSRGGYWRGGVWLPLAYMSIKALERYGFHDLADTAAETLVRHMCQTWREFEPHTIWEAYSPTEAKPSTHKRPDQMARPDFCGWSALGPLSLMIENVLGFFRADGVRRELHWRLRQAGRHGARNLRFGDVTASLIYDGHGQVEIAANRPFVLYLNRTPMQVAAGFSRVAARKTGGHGGRSRLCPTIAGLRRPRLHDDRSG